ncbi:class I adenylate-forming enzyme family protein [Noviherbaspirillum pedocola]|uniref:Acyl--CoA ligase n=1 Tax=Noviherbaspirillum pedocola TaxID=2801341 RepID=A0A934SWU0_9BURK|nr:class I adenylate-forming enzyme family protein [Noviherbaspirillum pedocola]MBK4738271.1 acyl--CoA ligase [Noviherbaspirillum pedocola]
MNLQSLDTLLEAPFGTIADLIHFHAEARPSHPALVQDERVVSYAELDALMDRVAASLQRDGVAARDAIAICAGSSIEYAALFLGALRAGVAVAPLAPSSTAASLALMIGDCEAKLLFLDAASAETLAPAMNEVRATIVRLDGSASPGWNDWLAAPGARPQAVDIQLDWIFNIIYSSGTTGTPKGITQPHSMRWMHVRRGTMNGYGPDAVTVVSTPLYSNTTLVSFFPTVALGGTAVLMAKFDAGAWLALAEKHRATHAMLVPVQYQRLMAYPDFDRHDLSSFRMKFCTSAPFSAVLKADILKRWPGGLIEYYGMTEGGGTCILEAHNHPDKLHTVGKPAPEHDIRLIDEAGREAAPGEIGEVVGHSGAMMSGYYRQPEKTAEAEWHSPEGKRFIRTGDMGRFDAEGFLTLLDRKKDMIISGGFNIYPSDLEVVLRQHPDVADASVVGVPSEAWGETPVAWVVKRGGSGLSEAALLDWFNAQVGKTQRLSALRFIDSLPRSAIGKVLKRELRDRYGDEVRPAR